MTNRYPYKDQGVLIATRITPELMETIKDYCVENERSVSYVLRKLLKETFEETRYEK